MQIDGGPGAQRHCSLDDVAQFAHVARPVVRLELAHGLAGDGDLAPAGVAAGLHDERLREGRDLRPPLAQRRDDETDSVQSEVEVLPEGATLHE